MKKTEYVVYVSGIRDGGHLDHNEDVKVFRPTRIKNARKLVRRFLALGLRPSVVRETQGHDCHCSETIYRTARDVYPLLNELKA